MSETATISMKIGEEVVGVFVKEDGEKEVLGQILQERFTDVSAIHELLSKGAIISAKNMSVYSEDTPEIWKSSNINEFIDVYGMKHNYVFDTEQNAWMGVYLHTMSTSVN